MNSAPARIPHLDGLRGIAILLVMVYHFSHISQVGTSSIDAVYHQVAMTGWLGVDLFFALSGFLITGILLDAKGSSNYFITFYKRRSLRIFPLYFTYVTAYSLALPLIVTVMHISPDRVEAAYQGVPWLWFYGQNLFTFATGDPGGFATGHLWSLAIEEQFYLVWPFVVAMLTRRRLLQVAVAMLLVAFLVRAGLAAYGVQGYQIYVFSFSRIDALAAGAIGALVAREPMWFGSANRFARRLTVVSFAALVLILFFFGPRAENHAAVYVFGLTVAAITAGCVVYLSWSAAETSKIKWLSSGWLMMFGTYSYALYMFHVPIKAVIYRFVGEPAVIFGSVLPWQVLSIILCGLVSLLAAWISRHVLELPFLRLGGTAPPFVDPSEKKVSAISGL